jgi:phosphoribosylformimino-5-aminoimidazole carboxamide ribotide isomerase
MRIIAAIDIINGKCVRLTRGDFNSSVVYNDDPVETAREIEDYGIDYLHVVDLDGAKNRKIQNIGILQKIAAMTKLKIDFGGGIRTASDIRSVLESGAVQVTLGSIAVSNRPLFLQWLNEFGPERIILGADSSGRKISSCGWLETSDNDVVTFISSYRKHGVKYVICTDIERDGMLQGPSVELYRDILAETDVSLIASGGVTSMQDIEELSATGCDGAIIGKAIYEGKLTLNDLGRYAQEKNNTVSRY